MIKRILWLPIAACLILNWSCQARKKGVFSVSGTFKNADRLSAVAGPVSKVYLYAITFGKEQPPVVVDSAKIPVSSGSFSLSTPAKPQQLFELMFGNDAVAVPIINDGQDIKVNVDLGKKDDYYEVSGSEASSQLKELIILFGKKNYNVEAAMADLDSLRQHNAPDSVVLTATAKKNAAIQDLNTYLKQFINTSSNGTVAAMALSWSFRSFTRGDFESTLADLIKKYPDNVTVTGLKQGYDQQMAQAAMQQGQPDGNSWVGKPAPELSLPDAKGHTVSLASFKGKYVLVDFWASWCGPCRAENPNVVKAYDEFKGKNFAILGVSLDKDKEPWQEAVRQDNLAWTQVSDLKFWNSKAVDIFKFDGIPFNVLVDPQGTIIAQSLRGDDLENKLKEVLGNVR